MFRRIVFVVTMLMFIQLSQTQIPSCVEARGLSSWFLAVMAKFILLRPHGTIRFYLKAHGLSAFYVVLGAAVIEDTSIQGDVVTLKVSRPDVLNLMKGNLPETIKEWTGYLSLANAEIPIKQEEVKLQVNSLGKWKYRRKR